MLYENAFRLLRSSVKISQMEQLTNTVGRFFDM